jgi:hypothetical protein
VVVCADAREKTLAQLLKQECEIPYQGGFVDSLAEIVRKREGHLEARMRHDSHRFAVLPNVQLGRRVLDERLRQVAFRLKSVVHDIAEASDPSSAEKTGWVGARTRPCCAYLICQCASKLRDERLV